ncbi:MAG: hypothetical protein JNL80_16195 [Phycisphaerae bacterium]|jgi:hypothetical protein|nr:hypothetical protein [Phycisphaerae bacterium]
MLTAASLAILLAASFLVGDPPPAPAPDRAATESAASNTGKDSLSLSLKALATSESGTVTIDLTDELLQSALEKLQTATSIPLRVDWDALVDLGIAKDDRIDFHVRDVPPLVALKSLAGAINADIGKPAIDAWSGQIILTSPRGLASYREMAIYEVADILADPILLEEVAKSATDPHDPASPTSPADPDDTEAPLTPGVIAERSMLERADRLIDIIVEHVDSEAWEEAGGSQGRVSYEAGRLIVSATAMTHQRLRSFLSDFRRQSPSSATTSWVIGSIPTAVLDRILEPTGNDGPPSPQAIVTSVRGAKEFRLLASPRVTSRLGDEATIDMSDGRNGSHCSATVTLDRARRTLAVRTKVQLTFGQAKANAESTLTGGAEHVVGLLRLPGGSSEAETWVVIAETNADPRDAPRN